MQHDPDAERGRRAHGEHERGHRVRAVAPERGVAGGAPPLGAVDLQPVDGVAAGPVGPQVLEPAQALLEVAVELGVDLPLGLAGGHRGEPQADEHRHARQRGHREDEAAQRVDHGGDDEHAGEQDDVAGQAHGDVGEEDGHGLDVAVDPLDELARAEPPVPGLLQPEGVGGQPLPQPVAGPPRHPGRPPHDHQVEQGAAEWRRRRRRRPRPTGCWRCSRRGRRRRTGRAAGAGTAAAASTG